MLTGVELKHDKHPRQKKGSWMLIVIELKHNKHPRQKKAHRKEALGGALPSCRSEGLCSCCTPATHAAAKVCHVDAYDAATIVDHNAREPYCDEFPAV